ncbi:MAG: beta-N-acetylglucosaminidase domain-containing protein [Oceanicoccus sp.]
MSQFFYGAIEGFYGRQWSWQTRKSYAKFFRQFGFGAYVYAPKGDLFLRSRWRELHPASEWAQLHQLAAEYQQQGVQWGLGLSPLGLGESYQARDKSRIVDKVTRINELNPDILCILFDDMRGDFDGMLQRQLDIIDDVVTASSARRFIVCPTYYSFDPVLEQVFGTMPSKYLETLGESLPEDIGIFWTGKRVISTAYDAAGASKITNLLKRKPVLWDNYPVNDGRLTSKFLHLEPYKGRPRAISEWYAGHLVNPMNQPLLSQIVLQSLDGLYRRDSYSAEAAFNRGLALLDETSLEDKLRRDSDAFQHQGLGGLSERHKRDLLAEYQSIGHPAANEVADWLAGEYQFDPACLTD